MGEAPTNERFRKTLKKIWICVRETHSQLHYLNAIEDQLHGKRVYDFLAITYLSIFDSMFSNLIRVFDRDSKSATFWYLYRCKCHDIDKRLEEVGNDLTLLNEMADRTKELRTKIHFHIDRDSVKAPHKVWEHASMEPSVIDATIRQAEEILLPLVGEEFSFETDPILDCPDSSGLADFIEAFIKLGATIKPSSSRLVFCDIERIGDIDQHKD